MEEYMGLIILGILLIVWGLLVAALALFKPRKIWAIGKIQGFVNLLGDKGTMILFVILGAAAIAVGIVLLV